MTNPALENLPTELQIQILRQLPIADLKSLVLASPAYHQSYLLARYEILESLAYQNLGEDLDLVEALTVIRSKGIHFTNKREEAITLLDIWRRRNEIRERENEHISFKHLVRAKNVEEVLELFDLHKKLSFFLEDFSINAPKPLTMALSEWETTCMPLRLSTVEKRRFLRALCRLQIMNNIFGDQIRCVNYPHCDSCSNQRVWQWGETTEPVPFSMARTNHGVILYAYRLFYGTIPPWEYEEMGSVLGYLRAKFTPVFEEIQHDLRRLCRSTPCEYFWDIIPEEERPPSGGEIEVESDLVSFNRQIPGLAGFGPEFLYRILHMGRLARRNLVCVNSRSTWKGPFIGINLGFHVSWDDRFPFIEPAGQHDRPGFEQFWSSLPSIDQPNWAWKDAWLMPHDAQEDLESSMRGDGGGIENHWYWCYALWDTERMEKFKPYLTRFRLETLDF